MYIRHFAAWDALNCKINKFNGHICFMNIIQLLEYSAHCVNKYNNILDIYWSQSAFHTWSFQYENTSSPIWHYLQPDLVLSKPMQFTWPVLLANNYIIVLKIVGWIFPPATKYKKIVDPLGGHFSQTPRDVQTPVWEQLLYVLHSPFYSWGSFIENKKGKPQILGFT